jgi:Cu/Ag efflux pump CusA
MVDSLIRWSLHNRTIILALAAAFLLWGGYSISKMPVDVLPDLSAPTVTILVEGPGMVPTEMESLVTFPIESALNGAAGVRRVRSATAVGVAVIWVEFEWGQDIQRARQIVTEKLNTVSGSLPTGVETPFLAPVSSIMGEILFISLESTRHSPLELRTVAETLVRRRILAVPGVSQVIPTGGGQKQYQVLVDAQRLRSYDVTLDDVETALKTANRNSSAGFMTAGGQEYLIQAWDAFVPRRHRPDHNQNRPDPPGSRARCGRGANRRSPQAGRRFPQCQAVGNHRNSETAWRKYAGADPHSRCDNRRRAAHASGRDDD